MSFDNVFDLDNVYTIESYNVRFCIGKRPGTMGKYAENQ